MGLTDSVFTALFISSFLFVLAGLWQASLLFLGLVGALSFWINKHS